MSEEAEKEERMGLCGLAKDGEDLSEGWRDRLMVNISWRRVGGVANKIKAWGRRKGGKEGRDYAPVG